MMHPYDASSSNALKDVEFFHGKLQARQSLTPAQWLGLACKKAMINSL
jgi:hypothetical protein